MERPVNNIEAIEETVSFLRDYGFSKPEVGIILGTGLGQLVDHMEVIHSIDYAKIPNFPVATVEFHKGKLIYGKLGVKTVIVMQGRFHYYEGYTLQQVTFPVRVMKMLGIAYLLVSNAGGAMNLDFKKGSLMLLDDHINLLPGSPLVGHNIDRLGPRFPDMSRPYDPMLSGLLERIAQEDGIELNKGVYVAVSGPNFETRSEYRFLKAIGADVVGMSTVPEVIVANHMDLPVAAISVITDECDPGDLKPFDLEDILASAAVAEQDLVRLVRRLMDLL